MARFLLVLLATSFILSISSTLCAATDSPATSFIRKTCNETTYTTRCLNTLLPNTDRFNGNTKKATRLAIMATVTEVQSASNNIQHYADLLPRRWTHEVESLENCHTDIADSVIGLYSALEETNHLGGGSKDVKESKRLNMETNVKSVLNAIHDCANHLQKSKGGMVVVKRVEEILQPLNELATNAVSLVHHMEF
ncbi:pectinesterase inhibitor 11-like [Chenopodium quinoa]|uniref:Pectinesterase inhibitor domain-containing protein n=1 Tax=Chenopodium quinoa TaxID=63459 RepID=A0A803LYU2_CHEQI|nr:pectinesterase inhibitor 11-like [Chenopodium quinoa]